MKNWCLGLLYIYIYISYYINSTKKNKNKNIDIINWNPLFFSLSIYIEAKNELNFNWW